MRCGALDFPAFAVTPQFAFVFVAAQHAVAAVGSNPIDSALAHALTQRIAIVALIGDHAPWLAPWTAPARAWHSNRGQHRLGHMMFGGLGGADVHPQRRAMPLHRQNQLPSLAPHGFADRLAPFLACRNVASTKASFQSICPVYSTAAGDEIGTERAQTAR